EGSFVHEPGCSVSVWPCCAVPVIVGGAVFDGAPLAGSTISVASEVAGAPSPPALLALSRTAIVWPTSAVFGTCVCAVAPEIGWQEAPNALHCSHWSASPRRSSDLLPLCSVSVWPCCAVPLIVGGDVFDGGGGTTAAVASELTGPPEPPSLLASSATRSMCSTSAATGTYVLLVAPLIAKQFSPAPSQRSHW